MLLTNGQGIGVVLHRHWEAGGHSKLFPHRSACPTWQVVSCVCHTAPVINPASGGDTEGKRFVSKFSSFLCRTLNYVL